MPENKKFWKFCNQVGNTVELLLYGDISQTSKIVVRINSGGEMCLPPRQSEISWSSTRRR